jgi:hypothetical protein
MWESVLGGYKGPTKRTQDTTYQLIKRSAHPCPTLSSTMTDIPSELNRDDLYYFDDGDCVCKVEDRLFNVRNFQPFLVRSFDPTA